MESQRNFVNLQCKFGRQDIDRGYDWKVSSSSKADSPLDLAMGICLPGSIASDSTLDLELTSGFQCWNGMTLHHPFFDKRRASRPQTPIFLSESEGHSPSKSMEGSSVSEKVPQVNRSPTAFSETNESPSFTTGEDLGPGAFRDWINQHPPFEYQEGSKSLFPTNTSGCANISTYITSVNSSLRNCFGSLARSIPWQLDSSNVQPSGTSLSGFAPDKNVQSPYESSFLHHRINPHLHSYNSGNGEHPPNLHTEISALRDFSGYVTLNPSLNEEYDQTPLTHHSGFTQSAVSPSTLFPRALSNVFIFGSSGMDHAYFDLTCMSTIGESSTHSMTENSSHDRMPHSSHCPHEEDSGFTWSQATAMPMASLHPPPSDVDSKMPSAYDHSTPSGTLSMIHVNTALELPGLEDAPPRMDELIVNFETNPGIPASKGKRKAFSTEGRKKVKIVRRNGACFACRARKVSCSEEGVCGPCGKAAHGSPLAIHICWRNKFKDIYIGVKDIHRSLWARKEKLGDILASLVGPPKQVMILVRGGTEMAPKSAMLQLQVMQCQSSAICRWKSLRKEKGIYITSHFVHDQRYVIVPSSLPSIDQLDLFGRQILSFSDESHSGPIIRGLDNFLLHYCRPDRPSRLRHLADQTLQIASLNGLVAYGFIDLYDGSYDLLSRPPSENKRYVSETVHDQIRLRAAEGVGAAEEYIFHELDNLREITGSSDNHRIVVGICLLRLTLLYRERMVRDEIRLGLPRHGKRRHGHQARLEKAALMYQRLTVVYSTLCRGSDSPMTMLWKSESGVDVGEEDMILRSALLRLQATYTQFCDEKLMHQHDDLFRTLIVDSTRKWSQKRRIVEQSRRRATAE